MHSPRSRQACLGTAAVACVGLCLGKPAVAAIDATPVLAVVALKEQRITVYGTNGMIMDARVSTGRSGYETPPGVFSILEKRREHYSNLYDDASMPFMQRLTWSGIALHAGVLPGRPASHGCIRMPYGFAGQLFEATRLGMRVVVVPSDIRPTSTTRCSSSLARLYRSHPHRRSLQVPPRGR
jgi:L,D-transpeptidase catalytic domain